MIVIKLREAMLAYGRRRGEKLTYEELGDMTGIPVGTLQSIGGRRGYHAPLARIEVLCRALNVPLHDMLEMVDDPPQAKPKPKRSTKRRTKK